MYKIIGADGKEYGPITIEQLGQWAAQGRVNPQTRVKPEGAPEWKSASEIAELQGFFSNLQSAPTPAPLSALPTDSLGPQQKGLAITSLVLGILSLVCFGPFTGIPAIICGHIAHGRARRSPGQYGGAGLAVAGFVMGYAGLALTIVLVAFYSAMLIPALSQAKGKAQEIKCSNNMRQIGLAFKTWEIAHSDQFPFNVRTNAGGTLELCAPGPDGYDKNGFMHLLVMSNELGTPGILVCPADKKPTVQDWSGLTAANVSYQIISGPAVNSTNVEQVLAVCPIHHNVLRTDGSVQRRGPGQRGR
jgi:hypothetical protein